MQEDPSASPFGNVKLHIGLEPIQGVFEVVGSSQPVQIAINQIQATYGFSGLISTGDDRIESIDQR
jgi:hypothetical protein